MRRPAARAVGRFTVVNEAGVNHVVIAYAPISIDPGSPRAAAKADATLRFFELDDGQLVTLQINGDFIVNASGAILRASPAEPASG